jgi:hypothetical protein
MPQYPSEEKPIKIIKAEDGKEYFDTEILTPRQLTEKAAMKALDEGKESADSYEALRKRIKDYNFGHDSSKIYEFNNFLLAHKDMIIKGLRAFGKLPAEYVKKHGHPRVQNPPPPEMEKQIMGFLTRENYQADGKNYYTFEEICSALEVLVTHMREKVEPASA